ncbi:MAG: hypothetical protein DRN99_09480, partial [Thermoproteota archaeon]
MSYESVIQENLNVFLGEFKRLLRVRSISADERYAGELEEAAAFIQDELRELGAVVRLLKAGGGAPAVFGELEGASDRTLLVYAHYDVQPAGSEAFNPAERGGRIYARGASDNKGSLMAVIHALRVLLEVDGHLPVGVRLLFEGEEERGSPHLAEILESNRRLLEADEVLCADLGGVTEGGTPVIELGLKGILLIELLADSSSHPSVPGEEVHSSFAPVVANPCWLIIDALASLREDGRVAVEGFYDDVEEVDSEALALIEKASPLLSYLSGELEIKSELKPELLRELVLSPTLNVNMIAGGHVAELQEPRCLQELRGRVKTIVPSWCIAKVDMRLVPSQDPDEIYRLVEAHVRKRAPGVRLRKQASLKPYRLPWTHPLAERTIRVAKETYGKEPYVLPNSRASGGMSLIPYVLKAPMTSFSIGAYGVAHKPSEYIRI